jgi:hypothetical protein
MFWRAKSVLVAAFAAFCVLQLAGCGYQWQRKSTAWSAKGVHRVFVRTLVNNTLISGIEVPFSSALLREFARGERIGLVTDEKLADAYVTGTVDAVVSQPNSQTTVDVISNQPAAKSLTDFVIASDYLVTAGVTVRLVRTGSGEVLWTQAFSQAKIYPGGNRFGQEGSTSSLINSSQEHLAVNDIAQIIASDAYDTMLEAF